MIRYFISIASAFAAISSVFASDTITFIDSTDSLPIEGVTVMSTRGVILGMSDESGRISVSPKEYPLDIRCMGFLPRNVVETADTVMLHPATYQLAEVTVQPEARPIIKVTSFVREYCTGATTSDTLQLYTEHMLVSYNTVDGKKVKGFKGGDTALRPRSTRRYARFANSQGLDSVAVPNRHDEVSYLSYYNLLLGVPFASFPENENIRSGTSSDTVMGKHSYKALYKKTNELYTCTYDMLADYEGHRCSPTLFKLFGMSMDIDKLQRSFIYTIPSDRIYTLNEFISLSGGLHALAKGKMFKWMMGLSNFYLDCYAELYPVDIEYISVEEYKEERKERKDGGALPFSTPRNLQPLPSSVQNIIDRVKKQKDSELENQEK